MNKATLLLLSFLLLSKILPAQNVNYCSTIYDNNGIPFEGATIYVEGKKTMTISNSNGEYCIQCLAGDIIKISFIGRKTIEIPITVNMIIGNKTNKSKTVEQLKRNTYSKLLKQKHDKSYKFTDMYSAPYKWQFRTNSKFDVFHCKDFKEIIFKDSVYEFIRCPPPIYSKITYNSMAVLKIGMKKPKLQTIYSQGRPVSGVDRWFGADNNEIFAWGPKINTLSFDGSEYPYDVNGRLIQGNQSESKSITLYNPYDIFKKGYLLKNTLNMAFIKYNNSFNIKYTNIHERGLVQGKNITDNIINFNFTHKKKDNKWSGNINYSNSKNNYAFSNLSYPKLMSSIMLTPPTFDNSQGYIFNNGTQRSSAPDYKNNPYFLLNLNSNTNKSFLLSTDVTYNFKNENQNIFLAVKYDKSVIKEEYFNNNNSASLQSSVIQNKTIKLSNYHSKFLAEKNYRVINFQTAFIYNYENIDFIKESENLNNLRNKNYRQTFNIMNGIILNPIFIELNVKNNIYLKRDKNKWFLPNVAMGFRFDDLYNIRLLERLILSGSYSTSVTEQPMFLSDKSYSTLLTDLNQLNTFVEKNELFYDKTLDLETRNSLNVGIEAVSVDFPKISRLSFIINYSRTLSENSIFPVINSSSFVMDNVADIKNQNLEINLSSRIEISYKVNWYISCTFSKSKSIVQKIHKGYKRVPIAGFQSVSKNLIEGEPVGVIMGSVYQRNKKGQLIIGSDGYPLIDNNKQIIGNPNPDYSIILKNRLRISQKMNFTISFEYQKGGDIWNGTKNALDYYGLSEKTGNEREVTNFVFDGVNESGQINTTPVDFANPANGLNGNKWIKYGIGGVAEDAIEDGTKIILKQIAFLYDKRFDIPNKIINIRIKLFVNNLWVYSKYTGCSPISSFNNYIKADGLDYFNMPDTKEIGLSIGITF